MNGNKKSSIVDVTISDNSESMCVIRNRYRIIDKIGSGGNASVWKCIDLTTNEYCAIKIYSEGALNHTQAKLVEKKHKQFSYYNHPNIVPIIDSFTDNEYLHVVMPYYKRGALLPQSNALTEDVLWRVCLDIANGLMFLHEHDVIHLDVKPANILQSNTGEYILSDYCISQDKKELTHINLPAKTYGAATYMAPERFFSGGYISTACDIWALGATLYELAIGVPPFDGLGGRKQIQTKEDLLPLPIGQQYSKHMNDLIMTCLRPNPQERPSAKDLVVFVNDKSKSISLKNGSESLSITDFFGYYSNAAQKRLADYIIDKDLLSGLYGITDNSGKILVEHVYDSISTFHETTWPGPGPLPPQEYFFLGAFFKHGDYVGYLCIHEDGSITEYRRCQQEEFKRLSQLT
ncbi:MAG: serine/threonine-protein kinase [Bacteroidales bacterium]|nr:serine/threonine-protein kinase [Bacteroidales bacterium]